MEDNATSPVEETFVFTGVLDKDEVGSVRGICTGGVAANEEGADGAATDGSCPLASPAAAAAAATTTVAATAPVPPFFSTVGGTVVSTRGVVGFVDRAGRVRLGVAVGVTRKELEEGGGGDWEDDSSCSIDGREEVKNIASCETVHVRLL